MKGIRNISQRYYLRQIAACFLISCMFFNTSVLLAIEPGSLTGSTGLIGANWGDNTVINTDNGAILDWSNFNTTSSQSVTFNQYLSGNLNSASAVLNRISSGAIPTQFDGALSANGRVFIVNPAGVIFGAGSSVNVAQLVASSLNISNADFLSGKYEFAGGTGSVINKGTILADSVALIGKRVLNSGTITSPGGLVIMAAGDKVLLGEPGSNIAVELVSVTRSDVTADGMLDGDVINEGTVNAQDGKIVLASGDTFSRAIGGIDGLSVAVDGGAGRVGQFGTLNADGTAGDGGSITLTAADTVALSSESLTTANAGTSGSGGEIIVYSPDTAIFHDGAKVEAKGGAVSGKGGFFELSGKQNVQAAGQIDLTAANGIGGMFLIDPYNLTIVPGTGSTNVGSSENVWTPTASPSTLGIDTLEGYLGTSNVTLSTFGNTGGTEDGDIIFDGGELHSGIDPTTGEFTNHSLYVRAYDDIMFEDGSRINFEGNGDVELYAGVPWGDLQGSGTGSVTSVERGKTPNIWTRAGDIIIDASGGGIDMGTLQSGIENTADSADDVIINLIPGAIRLTTTDGGDISLQHINIEGRRYGSAYVNSSGSLTINGSPTLGGAVSVRTNSTSTIFGKAASFICLIAAEDVTINGDVLAFAKGDRTSVAGVWIGAGTNVQDPVNGYAGTVTINDKITADASASGALVSDATIRIYGATINLPKNSAKYPEAKTQGSISVRSNTTMYKESDGAVYYEVDEYGRVIRDADGNPVIVENPDPLMERKLGLGYRAVVEIDATKDGTCLVCENKIRIVLPIANPDQWEQSKNLLANITTDFVLSNDEDGFGALLVDGSVFLGSFTTANGGTLTLSVDGTQIIYTPPLDWADNFVDGKYVDTFEYYAQNADGLISQDPATVTITLTNQMPVANDNSYGESHNVQLSVTAADGTITGTLNSAVADYDPDNQIAGRIFDDVLTVEPIVNALTTNGGHITLNADGSFTYTPSADNKTGTDSFTYTLKDGFGGTDTAIVTINLTNQDPVAYNNSYSESHNVQLSVNAADGTITGTLNSATADYDPDNQAAGKVFDDVLSVEPIVNALTTNGGHVTLNADGSFTYTPSADNKTGTDTFTYTLKDDFGGTDTAVVTINLTNQDPVAYDNSYSNSHKLDLTVNATDGTITGTLNGATADYDPDNQAAGKLFDDVLSVEPIIDGLTTNGGHVTLNADGSFTYTPSTDNKTGTDSFTYTLKDDFGGTDTAIVTINLTNENPVAYDNTYSNSHNIELSVNAADGTITGTLNSAIADYDPDNDTLTVEPIVNGLTTNGGHVTLNADGSFAYTPSADNKTGTDTFTYTLNDDYGGTDTAIVTINLTNQDPVAYDNGYSNSHNIELSVNAADGTITGTLNSATADYDPDNQAAGKLFDDTLSVDPIVNGLTTNGGHVTLNADGSFTYTPSADNKTGTDTFTYTLNDDYGGTDTAIVTINLTNQDPVAYDNSYSNSHNIELSVNAADGTITGTLNSATADYDPDNQAAGKVFNDTLTVEPITNGLTTNGGQVTLNADGSFTYTPSADNKTGTDSFTYTLKDDFGGTDTAIVTINLTNQDPVAYNNNYDNSHNVQLTVNAADGTITGTLNSATADYDPDNQAAGKLFNDTLTVEPIANGLTANGGHVTLNADGSFTYTPSADNETGTDSFTYTLKDDFGGTDTAIVTINLTNENPVAYDNTYNNSHNIQLTVNASDGTITGTLNSATADYDPDNQAAGKVFDDTLSVDPIVNALTTNGGHVTLNADGSFTYTPSADNKTGTDSFNYTLKDNFGGTDTASVTINLTNQAPVARPDSYSTTTNEPIDLTVPDSLPGVIDGVVPELNGDYDPDNQAPGKLFDDTITSFLPGGLSNGTTANGGTVTLHEDGTFTYTPPSGFSGTDTFTYYVTDTYDNSQAVQVTIFVSGITLPAAPVPVIRIPEAEGCPAVIDAAATEIGMPRQTIQVSLARAMAGNAGIQPCDTCSRLVASAAILRDADGSGMAALVAVINSIAPANVPYTPEIGTAIATAFEENRSENTQYARALEYIEAFVQYISIVQNQMGLPIDDPVAFTLEKYGTGLSEQTNPNVAAYVGARLAEAAVE